MLRVACGLTGGLNRLPLLQGSKYCLQPRVIGSQPARVTCSAVRVLKESHVVCDIPDVPILEAGEIPRHSMFGTLDEGDPGYEIWLNGLIKTIRWYRAQNMVAPRIVKELAIVAPPVEPSSQYLDWIGRARAAEKQLMEKTRAAGWYN